MFIFFTNNIYAQLKVFSGGSITIGGTNTPLTGYNIHHYGNSLFSDDSFTGTSNSAAFIRGLSDYSTTPDYTWFGDDGTGLFHPDQKFIGFSIFSSEAMRITDKKNLVIGTPYDSDFRLLVEAHDDQTVFGTVTYFSGAYHYAHYSYCNQRLTKNWAVEYNGNDQFFVLADGNVWARTYYSVSDSTLKQNIIPLQNSRNKVLQLRGVSYNFKPFVLNNMQDTFTVISSQIPKTEIGLIAQEVEQVVPEVIETTDNGIKTIAYPNLIALLVEAFKEQNLTIDSLRTRINECCIQAGNINRLRQSNDSGLITNNNSLARLDQNIPNPFTSNTKISFNIPEGANSKVLMILNLEGLLLKQYEINSTGENSIIINGGEFEAGMYLYALLIDGKEIDTKRMILTK